MSLRHPVVVLVALSYIPSSLIRVPSPRIHTFHLPFFVSPPRVPDIVSAWIRVHFPHIRDILPPFTHVPLFPNIPSHLIRVHSALIRDTPSSFFLSPPIRAPCPLIHDIPPPFIYVNLFLPFRLPLFRSHLYKFSSHPPLFMTFHLFRDILTPLISSPLIHAPSPLIRDRHSIISSLLIHVPYPLIHDIA